MKKIIDEISEKKIIALVGNCKNSGKTTTLNYLLKYFKNAGVLTIGLDGEDVDLLYGTFKPKVHINKGQYVLAHISQLRHNFEIVEKVPLKDIYISRALCDSDISIVNPGGRSSIIDVVNKMQKFSDVVFIDGAFDKIFSLSIVKGVILCVGNSDKNLSRLKNIYTLLNLPTKNIVVNDNSIYKNDEYYLIDCDLMKKECLNKVLKDYDKNSFLTLKGSLTWEMAQFMKNVKVVLKDPSRVFLSNAELEYFFSNGNKLFVNKNPEIIFVSLNTFTSEGIDTDPDKFYCEVKNIVKKNKCINLMNGGA